MPRKEGQKRKLLVLLEILAKFTKINLIKKRKKKRKRFVCKKITVLHLFYSAFSPFLLLNDTFTESFKPVNKYKESKRHLEICIYLKRQTGY